MAEISIEKCFQILGLELTANLAEVKEAHRFLVQTFHEDKYPVDSAMRAKAKEKMIELNDAYARLKNFFEENPDGYKLKGGGSQPGDGDGSDGEAMDWQSWQSRQEAKADGAVQEWQEEERQRRARIKVEEEKNQRKQTVNFGMIGAWLVLSVMWMGHGCTGAEHRYSDGSRVDFFKDTLAYKIQMGTATTADYERLAESKDGWNKDAEKNNGSMVVLYSMLAGMVYVSLFPKPKRLIANWIETGSFDDAAAAKASGRKVGAGSGSARSGVKA